MSGGQKQTSVSDIPSWQKPYVQYGMGQAMNRYASDPGAAPMNQDQYTGFNQIRDRATTGDPTINSANSYLQKTLGGGFLGQNPYLDQTFEQARLATQGGLSSEFARSGRNVDASQGNRAQELNQLATGIYGGAYDAERNRMQGVLPYASSLGNQGYTDANMLLQSGNAQRGIQQEQMGAPDAALQRYMGLIQGNYGGTSSQKTGNSGFSGSGALGGAAMGSNFGPWGTGIGAILGGLF